MDKLVTVATYLDSIQAHIMKGLLESEGIESFVFDELAAAYNPLVLGVRLVVRQSDLERAAKILGEEKQNSPGPAGG